ncbi:MAG: hypothetical protein FWG35_01815 [Spirochaetaceae bacterium]|nr:hypothetical protein [Spirochaetaceae bacterium]
MKKLSKLIPSFTLTALIWFPLTGCGGGDDGGGYYYEEPVMVNATAPYPNPSGEIPVKYAEGKECKDLSCITALKDVHGMDPMNGLYREMLDLCVDYGGPVHSDASVQYAHAKIGFDQFFETLFSEWDERVKWGDAGAHEIKLMMILELI